MCRKRSKLLGCGVEVLQAAKDHPAFDGQLWCEQSAYSLRMYRPNFIISIAYVYCRVLTDRPGTESVPLVCNAAMICHTEIGDAYTAKQSKGLENEEMMPHHHDLRPPAAGLTRR